MLKSLNPLASRRVALGWIAVATVVAVCFFVFVGLRGWWPWGLLVPAGITLVFGGGLLITIFAFEDVAVLWGFAFSVGGLVAIAINRPWWLWVFVPVAVLVAYVVAGIGLVRAARAR